MHCSSSGAWKICVSPAIEFVIEVGLPLVGRLPQEAVGSVDDHFNPRAHKPGQLHRIPVGQANTAVTFGSAD